VRCVVCGKEIANMETFYSMCVCRCVALSDKSFRMEEAIGEAALCENCMTNVLLTMCNEKIDCLVLSYSRLNKLLDRAKTSSLKDAIFKALDHYLRCEYDVDE